MPRASEFSSSPPLFPLFLKLEGRLCVIAGAGRIAESKITSLLCCGASVRVIAPHATPRIARWVRTGKIQWRRRNFVPRDLRGAAVAIATTSRREVNETVFRSARAQGIFCNAVDDPAHCDFYYPAVVDRGPLQIAISTAGASPALAQRLRKELEKQFPGEYALWLAHLQRARSELFARGTAPERRRRILHRQASRRALQDFLLRKSSAAFLRGQS